MSIETERALCELFLIWFCTAMMITAVISFIVDKVRARRLRAARAFKVREVV